MTALEPALARVAPAEVELPIPAHLTRLADGFLIGYRNPRTRTAYRYDLAAWFRWCLTQGRDPLGATRTLIETHARWMEELAGARPASVARRLSALGKFYEWCQDEGVLDHDPAKRVRRPKVSDASQRLGLSREQTRTLLDHAAERPMDALVVALLLFNGLRASEAAGIQVEHLGQSLGHRTLWLRGKGDKEVTVPLPPPVLAALDHYLTHRGDQPGPLFLNQAGRPLTRQNVDAIIRRLGRRLGLPLRPHDMRHTAVTLELEAGVPLEEVQDFARHADPRTTQRYNRARHRLDKHASYRLAAYI
jgi:integrase/recombinase XerD